MSVIDDLTDSAQALEASGDLVLAHSKWEEAARLRPDVFVLSRLGRSLMLLGKLSEAAHILERLIRDNPNKAEVYFTLGFTYKRQNRLDAAKDILERGLELQDLPTARVLLGEVYRQLDRPEPAQRHLRDALTKDPDNSEGWYSLGLIHRASNPLAAVDSFSKAVQADPGYSAAYRELGLALFESGDVKKAEESIRRSIGLDPSDVWAHCYLGTVLKRMRRLDDADREFRKAIELEPDEPLFLCNLGDVLAIEGNWDNAEQCYLNALSKDVSNYLANFRYGQFLVRRGYPKRAIAYLERALSADPGNEKISKVLKRARAQGKDC